MKSWCTLVKISSFSRTTSEINLQTKNFSAPFNYIRKCHKEAIITFFCEIASSA